jgi:hypothetical protein
VVADGLYGLDGFLHVVDGVHARYSGCCSDWSGNATLPALRRAACASMSSGSQRGHVRREKVNSPLWAAKKTEQ